MLAQSQRSETVQQGGLRWLRSLQILAVIELVLGVLILFFMICQIGVSSGTYDLAFTFPLMIWSSVSVVSGGLGIGAFRGNGLSRRNKCLTVGHFVMCIVAAIIDFSTICGMIAAMIILHIAEYQKFGRYGYDGGAGPIRTALAFSYLVLFAALAHMICSIVTTAFTCCNWCAEEPDQSNVITYSPNQSDAVAIGFTNVKSHPAPVHKKYPA